MDVTFHGGAGTVTGSKTLVTAGERRVLIDCGMFQGLKQHRLRNWAPAPFDVQALDAIVLTHAHLDHSGWLPRIVREGYRGPIYCTEGTAALLGILLHDAAHLQMEAAKRANRRRYTRHRPAEALYTTEDADRALALVQPIAYEQAVSLGDDVEVSFLQAGHILGAASVLLSHADRRVLFSGDLGRPHDLLMKAPHPLPAADLLVLESTYGNRLHGKEDALDALAKIVNRVVGRGGVLMIPAFAVGRSQAVIYLLSALLEAGRIPKVPIYLNSPMAINVTNVFFDHSAEHRLNKADCRQMGHCAKFVRTTEASKQLNESKGPMIVIAGSGMATGGRILHHLKAFGSDPKNGLLLVGFQAVGTRGASIAAGAESVKIHGKYVPINAERFRMDSLSGHADWQEIVEWLRDAPTPGRIVLNHGEPLASDRMRLHLDEELGLEATVAEDGTTISV
jgi:metallo-beta-lactamase family protein